MHPSFMTQMTEVNYRDNCLLYFASIEKWYSFKMILALAYTIWFTWKLSIEIIWKGQFQPGDSTLVFSPWLQ